MRDHQSVVKNNNTSQVLSVMDGLIQGNVMYCVIIYMYVYKYVCMDMFMKMSCFFLWYLIPIDRVHGNCHKVEKKRRRDYTCLQMEGLW